MATVAISVDASRVRFLIDRLNDARDNVEQGMMQVIDEAVMPRLSEASTTTWNVRTGNYSQSWYSDTMGKGIVRVGSDAGYSAPLEWGWTLRNGGFKSSPGVLYPVAYETATDVAVGLLEWLKNQIAV